MFKTLEEGERDKERARILEHEQNISEF